MAGNEYEDISIPDQRDDLLQSAREECRLLCTVAKLETYDVAMFMIREGVTVELIRDEYGRVITQCEGPSVIKVCGAEEGTHTYACEHPAIKSGGSIFDLVKSGL